MTVVVWKITQIQKLAEAKTHGYQKLLCAQAQTEWKKHQTQSHHQYMVLRKMLRKINRILIKRQCLYLPCTKNALDRSSDAPTSLDTNDEAARRRTRAACRPTGCGRAASPMDRVS